MRSPRSTVGTVTEIYDYLRLLFSSIGQPHCHQCGAQITRQSVDQIVTGILELPEGERVMILAPIVRGRKGEFKKELEKLHRDGFVRARIDGQMTALDAVDAQSLKSDIPAFRAGDTLKVHVKVVEGNKTRVQVFQGVVIARSGSGINETFTVRKVSYGVGVERIFPLHTPIIEKIEVVTRGDVRRAKLYYLRDLRGKKAKIKELRDNA